MTTAGNPAEGLSAALMEMVDVEWWRCSDDDVREAVVELERQAARLEAVRLRVLAEAHERSVGTASGAPSTGDWFAAATTSRREHARGRVELAVALHRDLQVTGAALAAGELTGDHARVVHQAVTHLHPAADPATRAEVEVFLVEQARVLDPRQLARAGRTVRHRLDPGAGEGLAAEEDRQVRRRQVRCTQVDDGTWLLSGVLDAVGGATVMAALDPLAAPRPAASGAPDTRAGSRRLADALVDLADAYLAGQVGTESSRPRLVVTVPAQTVRQPGLPGLAPGVLAGGAPVSAATVGVLSCDAEVVPVLVDAVTRAPLDVGRTVYAFPDRVRRAIMARDSGCTYPGCTRDARWTQVHHLLAYSKGGATSERNGACLCGFHHRLVHRQGWRGELVGSQVAWHPPDGQAPLVPPPPWLPALDRLVESWVDRAA